MVAVLLLFSFGRRNSLVSCNFGLCGISLSFSGDEGGVSSPSARQWALRRVDVTVIVSALSEKLVVKVAMPGEETVSIIESSRDGLKHISKGQRQRVKIARIGNRAGNVSMIYPFPKRIYPVQSMVDCPLQMRVHDFDNSDACWYDQPRVCSKRGGHVGKWSAGGWGTPLLHDTRMEGSKG
jgi:hypothetical protein